MRGDFERGWAEYEWRWKLQGIDPANGPFSKPLWDGSDLHGRRILLQGEQGLGDTIQFVRYVSEIAARGGRVLLSSKFELQRLFAHLKGIEQYIPPNEAIPPYDLHCPLMSLPLRLKTTLSTIPAPIPYLQAEARLAAQWREKLLSEPNLKVGICWAGSPVHTNDRNRSTVLESFAPLSRVSGVTYYSLQKGAAASQASRPPEGMRLIDLSPQLDSFDDTAAVISNLDLLISVDTSLVHLAGAMGRPVWTLLPFFSDWRWMLDRSDSPWYPTMRLFRQPRRGDWTTPIRQIIEAIPAFLSQRRSV
jgi:hypothetical protein